MQNNFQRLLEALLEASKKDKDSFDVECMECGKKFKAKSTNPKCPKCKSTDIDVAI